MWGLGAGFRFREGLGLGLGYVKKKINKHWCFFVSIPNFFLFSKLFSRGAFYVDFKDLCSDNSPELTQTSLSRRG